MTNTETLHKVFQYLDTTSIKVFQEISRLSFHYINCPDKGPDIIQRLDEYCSEESLDIAPMKKCLKNIVTFTKDAKDHQMTNEQVKASLLQLGLSEEKASLFTNEFKNDQDIPPNRSQPNPFVNRLLNIDWNIVVSTSSSEQTKAGNTFLQLLLQTEKPDGISSTFTEMTMAQFYDFLHEMEKVKATLETLTASNS